MRMGEPIDLRTVKPVPRQPQFIPEVDPVGFTVYKTDLQPWHPDWRRLRGDVWDEPHFKPALESAFWQHRLPGNPVNTEMRGGHSDAFDWDRHLAHVSNIYDLCLPYILTGGRLAEDDLGIRESGNGIPDIIDEARNEADFFLSIRDGEAYSQGVTNPPKEWTIMFQAGCTTMAAWANAANCAMLAEAFRIGGNDSLQNITRTRPSRPSASLQGRRTSSLTTCRMWAAPGCAEGTSASKPQPSCTMSPASGNGRTSWRRRAWSRGRSPQVINKAAGPTTRFGPAAYLTCPQERHYPRAVPIMV